MGEHADYYIDRMIDQHLSIGEPRGRRRCKRHKAAPPGSPLAKARIAAHSAFDPLWQFEFMTRDEAYAWLARKMHMRPERCHIGMMNINQCRQVVKLSEEYRKPE